MGWETRNGRRYFYKCQRDGHQVRKIYVGTGDVGRAAELALECRRERRDLVRQWLHEADHKFAELDAIDAELAVGLAAVLFTQHGVRMDSRAARRIHRKQGEVAMGQTVREIRLTPVEQEQWQHLSEQASRGDREAAAALLPFLDAHPWLQDRLGDLSRLALNQWLELVGGRDAVAVRATHGKVMQLVDSLRQDASDPLEELLARRAGLLWLQVHYFDIQLAQSTSRTEQEQEFLAKRQRTTDQAYATAIQALSDYQGRRVTNHRPSRKRVAV